MREWWDGCFLMMGVHVRTLLKKKTTWGLLFVSCLVLLCLLAFMENSKEEKSKIAIGVCDEDQSELSGLVCRELAAMELYAVTTGSEAELTALLRKGSLSSVCVLKKGFEASVQKGKTDKIITIYEPESGGALLLPDILAGVLMQDVCLAKSYELLSEYMKKSGRELTLTRSEYKAYVEETMKESGVTFSFEVSYFSGDGKEELSAPTQSMVYRQAVFAVFAMLLGVLSIYSVLPFWDMCHGKASGRLRMLPLKKGMLWVGSGCGALLLPGVFGILFLGVLFLKESGGKMDFPSFLICTMAYLCVIVGMMLFAAYVIRNQMVYQMGMLAMMLLFGVFGMVSVVEGLFLPEGMTAWIPNAWYVRLLTESLG